MLPLSEFYTTVYIRNSRIIICETMQYSDDYQLMHSTNCMNLIKFESAIVRATWGLDMRFLQQ